MPRQCSKCKLPIAAKEGWTRVEGQPIHRTCMQGIVSQFWLGLKADLVVNGQVLAKEGAIMDGYRSPGYLQSHRPSWVVYVAGKVVEVFREDIRLLQVHTIQEEKVPELVLKYTKPDHRGFTTLPHQVDQDVQY